MICKHCNRRNWRPGDICCDESLRLRKIALRQRMAAHTEHILSAIDALREAKKILERM